LTLQYIYTILIKVDLHIDYIDKWINKMNIPNKCPSCSGRIIVTELCCDDCKTYVKGNFKLPELACMEDGDDRFLKVFLSARGNIKEVERCLSISYPTVKSRLEALLAKLGLSQLKSEVKRRRLEIVEKLDKGELSAKEAIKMLRELEG